MLYIYARYVDDIFVEIKDLEQLVGLKKDFENISVLSFTYELNVNNRLPFLDVLVDTNGENFNTKVYHKPTSHGKCLNADSECIDRYKNSVVVSYLNRAYKVTQNWNDFHLELKHMKQILVNNNFSNTNIDSLINKFISSKLGPQNTEIKKHTIPIFYQAQTHGNSKLDERIINSIILKNIKCKNPESKLKLVTYYKNCRASNLVMKNDLVCKSNHSDRTSL